MFRAVPQRTRGFCYLSPFLLMPEKATPPIQNQRFSKRHAYLPCKIITFAHMHASIHLPSERATGERRTTIIVETQGTMWLPERQCVFQRDNVASGETMWLLERQCGVRRQDVLTIDWPPDRLRTCFRHQSELKWCEKLTGDVRNVQNTSKITKIRFQQIFTKNLKNWIKNYVDVKLKIKLFCGFKP